jgi:hypothetical protein
MRLWMRPTNLQLHWLQVKTPAHTSTASTPSRDVCRSLEDGAKENRDGASYKFDTPEVKVIANVLRVLEQQYMRMVVCTYACTDVQALVRLISRQEYESRSLPELAWG